MSSKRLLSVLLTVCLLISVLSPWYLLPDEMWIFHRIFRNCGKSTP